MFAYAENILYDKNRLKVQEKETGIRQQIKWDYLNGFVCVCVCIQ